MPRHQRNLQVTASADNDLIDALDAEGRKRSYTGPEKPEPPSDLWEKLEAMSKPVTPKRPENSFTVVEYAARFGIGIPTAQRRIKKLFDEGKLDRTAIISGHATIPFYTVKE